MVGRARVIQQGLCGLLRDLRTWAVLTILFDHKGECHIFLACSHTEEPLGHDALEDRTLIPFPGGPQGCETMSTGSGMAGGMLGGGQEGVFNGGGVLVWRNML